MSDPPAHYRLRQTFTDVDDLAEEARQWDLDFQQLDCGSFRGEILQFGQADVHISDARFSRSLNQKGAPPKDLRTIALAAHRDVRFVWRGKQVDGDCLLVFPRGTELASVSGPDFHVYTCSFPDSILSAAGQSIGLNGLDDLSHVSDAVRCETRAIAGVRDCLRQLCRSIAYDPRQAPESWQSDCMTSELPRRLLQTLAQANGVCPADSTSRRSRALEAAERYIRRHAQEDTINLRDICQAAGVSQRTLEYAFLHRFGMSPKQYLQAYRLANVRRQLRIANATGERIVDIANRWGFWHMGQFAADYRRRFGELPSVTLAGKGSA